jgi:hypothetical protein
LQNNGKNSCSASFYSFDTLTLAISMSHNTDAILDMILDA